MVFKQEKKSQFIDILHSMYGVINAYELQNTKSACSFYSYFVVLLYRASSATIE